MTNGEAAAMAVPPSTSTPLTCLPPLSPLEPDSFTYLGVCAACCLAALPCPAYGPNNFGRMTYAVDVVQTITKWGKAAYGGQTIVHDTIMIEMRATLEQMQQQGRCLVNDLGFYHVQVGRYTAMTTHGN